MLLCVVNKPETGILVLLPRQKAFLCLRAAWCRFAQLPSWGAFWTLGKYLGDWDDECGRPMLPPLGTCCGAWVARAPCAHSAECATAQYLPFDPRNLQRDLDNLLPFSKISQEKYNEIGHTLYI